MQFVRFVEFTTFFYHTLRIHVLTERFDAKDYIYEYFICYAFAQAANMDQLMIAPKAYN